MLVVIVDTRLLSVGVSAQILHVLDQKRDCAAGENRVVLAQTKCLCRLPLFVPIRYPELEAAAVTQMLLSNLVTFKFLNGGHHTSYHACVAPFRLYFLRRRETKEKKRNPTFLGAQTSQGHYFYG